MKKMWMFAVCAAVLVGLLSGCGAAPNTSNQATPTPGATGEGATPAPDGAVLNPTVIIEMESGDVMNLELYPDIAPNTVANFVNLAQSGFYDGLIFHRVIPGFMIQGGDPSGNGTGGPGYQIKGEFSNNGFKNDLKHTTGVISMARSQPNDSAGSQFFIMHADSPGLDGDYAAFGRITDDQSQKTVNKIATSQRDARDKPLADWTIKRITIETHGVQYSVEKIGG